MSKGEALLMAENERGREELSRCPMVHAPSKPSSSCEKPAREMVDGLVLCEEHALEAKLEGQIYCWKAMILHIDLWSR